MTREPSARDVRVSLRAVWVSAVPIAWIVLGCGSASSTPVASVRTDQASARCDYYDYRFELAADLRHMTGMVCFDGPPPRALICGPQGDGGEPPIAARISGGEATSLPTRRCHIDLTSLSPGDCVRYVIDLHAAERPMPMSFASHGASIVTTHAGAFLYRPETRAPSMHGHATLSLPEGVKASLPWLRDADGYLLDASAFEHVGYVAFGALDTERIVVPGAMLDVAILDDLAVDTRAAITSWMQVVAKTASQMGGAFPAERAQIILVPDPGAGGVRFGMIGRGGGPSVVFVLGRESAPQELVESWEPAHELTHLRTPLVPEVDRWLTEGIATYYQEVLRARSGVATPARAWERLHTRLTRAADLGSGRTLRDESADMYATGEFRRVYWAGVAFAWMADVELRRGSNNAISLDTVVLGLQGCCAASMRTWTAARTLKQMDALAGRPVFSELAQGQLDQTEFPDLAATFSALGITVSEGEAMLDPASPLAAVRDAIMAPVETKEGDGTATLDATHREGPLECGVGD